jgi:excisionase family DNA binding protein
MGYFTAPELARIVGYDRTHVARLCREGKIKAEKFGRMWMIPSSELDYLERKIKDDPYRKLPSGHFFRAFFTNPTFH